MKPRDMTLAGFVPLSEWCRDVRTTLDAGLTFADNWACTVKRVTLKDTDLPIYIQPTFTTPVEGVLCLRAMEEQAGGVRMSGNMVTWQMSGAQVKVTAVEGLTAGRRYVVTFLVLAG